MSNRSSPPVNSPDPCRGMDRRARVRYAAHQQAFCQPGSGRLEDHWWRATVQDISMNGIGLIVPRHFEPGTALTIELYHADQSFASALPIHVARTAAAPGGGWLLGCTLTHPLQENELKALREGLPEQEQ